MEIEAKQKPEKESFSIEISWIPRATCKDEEAQLHIKAFTAGQDGRDEKTVTDSDPVAIRPAVATSLVSPAGEKKLPDEMKSVDTKNKK